MTPLFLPATSVSEREPLGATHLMVEPATLTRAYRVYLGAFDAVSISRARQAGTAEVTLRICQVAFRPISTKVLTSTVRCHYHEVAVPAFHAESRDGGGGGFPEPLCKNRTVEDSHTG